VQAIAALAAEDGGPDSSRCAGLSFGLQWAVLRGIAGVAAARKPFGRADQPLWMGCEELSRFAGREISGPESIIPPRPELVLVAARSANRRMTLVANRAEPGAAVGSGGSRVFPLSHLWRPHGC
jgi:hypothetical protein